MPIAEKNIDTVMVDANVGLEHDQLAGVGKLLNCVLSDQFLLYTKTRNYHWNVVGPRFNDLHKFFQEQYEQLDELMDETAEFVRYFGVKALGTMAEFRQFSRLQEEPGVRPDEVGMIRNLKEDHESVIRHLRDDIEEAEELEAADVADYLTSLLEAHDKMAWMLRSLLGEG